MKINRITSAENALLASIEVTENRITYLNDRIEGHEYEWLETACGEKTVFERDNLEDVLALLEESLERLQDALTLLGQE